jgi:hypothetical protein
MKYEDGQVLELVVIKTEAKFTAKDKSYTQYEILGHDAKGREHTVAWFYHDGDQVFVKADNFYRGVMKKSKKGYFNWNNTTRIEKFGGETVMPTPFDEKPPDPAMERDCFYEAFGDVHTAAPIVAAMLANTGSFDDNYIYKSLYEVALVCREARRALTEQYIKEKKK